MMMVLEQILLERAEHRCELCNNDEDLRAVAVPPAEPAGVDNHVLLCCECRLQFEGEAELAPNHWRCLSDSMWSQVPAVQVLSWRMLKRLSGETWALDLLDILYLEPETLAWAQSAAEPEQAPTLDSNGTALKTGDNVVVIKDLNVKGAGFTAKRGTTVRSIALTSNPKQIEGKVNGVRIVLLAEYLKKA